MKNKKTVSVVEQWIEKEFTSASELPPNAITVEMVTMKTKMSRSNTVYRLNGLVEKGKLKKGKFLLDGKLCNYYIPVE